MKNDDLVARILVLEAFMIAVRDGLPSAALGDIATNFLSETTRISKELESRGHSETLRAAFESSVAAFNRSTTGSTIR